MKNFTKKELETISIGLLALMQNANSAMGMVSSAASRDAIEKEIAFLQQLNYKVCNMASDESE